MGMKYRNRAYRLKLLTSVVLASTLLLGLIGCSNETAEEPQAVDEAVFNQEGLPIVNEPITLDVLTVRWGNMGGYIYAKPVA